MISRKNDAFHEAFRRLPKRIQERARHAFELFRRDPRHKSLHFKRIHSKEGIYSARIGADYRALAYREGEALVWFWVGSHAEYEKLISR